MKRMARKLVQCMGAGLLLACSTTAWGAYTVWFPYANVSENSTFQGSPPWGGPGAEMYFQLGTMTPNVVWNDARVFYDTLCNPNDSPEGWYDSINGSKTWQIYIHNTSGTNFTGSYRLKLYIYTADGARANGSTLFNPGCYVPQLGTPLINTTASGHNITWDSVNECFLVEVDDSETVVINSAGAVNGVCSAPPVDHYRGLSVEIEQPQNLEFNATMRGQGQRRHRSGPGWPINNDWLAPKIAGFNFGYEGIHLSDYTPSATDTVTHPYFREQWNLPNAGMCWSSIIAVVNAESTPKSFTINAYQLDGTLTQSKTIILDGHKRLLFTPSQLMTLDSWPQREGYVDILSETPVGVGFNFRFAPCSGTPIAGFRPRTGGNQCTPLLINP